MVLNNYTEVEFDCLAGLVEAKVFNFFFGGKEVGESGTPHLQCVGRTPRDISIQALQRAIAAKSGQPSRWAIKVAQKGLAKNMQYCSKGTQSHEEWRASNEDGDNFGKDADTFQFGNPPRAGQGKRTDLDNVVETIQAGADIREVATAHGASFIRYHNGIRELMAMMKSAPRDSQTYGYWCFGPTGSGKSRWAHSIPGEAYVKDAANRWFDGYTGQETVILDDFRPNKLLTFQFLLTLADRYPMTVERKGSTLQFNSKRLIITTPHDIDSTFSHLEFLLGDIQQLKRRFRELDFSPGTIAPSLAVLGEEVHAAPPLTPPVMSLGVGPLLIQ